MFSPLGYTSFAKLWREFTSKHFVQIYANAADDYAGDQAKRSYYVGSPADICEQIFLKSFLDHRIVVAKDLQRIARVDVALDRQYNKIYKNASVFESTRIAENPEEAGLNGEFLQRFGSVRFKPWKQYHDAPEAWTNAYPKPSEVGIGQINIESARFHTLPYVFERLQFVVPDTVPPWASDAFHKEYVNRFVDEFPGWSFCIDDGDLADWSKSCPTYVSEFFACKDNPVQTGRPSKIGGIVSAIQQIYPTGIPNVPLKEMHRQIEAALGATVSESTVKRAVKRLKN
ncbi:hypothetical protein [Litoreibacter albidus]|uniref:Uncharacterized protein n=1 Tax=Litoreibacter albidus TaxID=670155 RepID=A0A1H3BGU2_9RHOB|nr:hypothetical protein [Litoreibacter albidus]SDX41200.1 hypothetical protein SAMN04488001_3141 [Litoreibacter albidus]